MLSILELADLMNLNQGDPLFFECFPIDKEFATIRFSDQTNTTVAYLKIEMIDVISGGIIMWSGAIVDIPATYALCNGTLGTPDLRDRFIVGAGTTYNPDDTGGSVNHNHTFTTDGHGHALVGPPGRADGPLTAPQEADINTDDGTTDNADGRPPYYALAFIMKL